MHGAFRLCGLEHCERSRGATEVKQATAVGRDRLVVAGAQAEKVAELVVAATEPLRRGEALGRVREARCRASLPSEPCVPLARHTAQASATSSVARKIRP